VLVDDPPLHKAPTAPEVPGYRFDNVLAIGGFSAVFTGLRLSDGAPVVCKLALGCDSTLVERFRREGDALHAIGPPHVPALYYRGAGGDGSPFLVMERIAGETLGTWIGRRANAGQLTTTIEFMGIARGVLGALAAIHERGIIHRDLKPDNVLLSGTRTVLIDFGLVGPVLTGPARLTGTGAILGTARYMAPEQIKGERKIDARADLYGAAVLLYEVLALRPPFSGTQDEIENGHLFQIPPPLPDATPTPPALEKALFAALAKLPSQRPHSATALLTQIERACTGPLDLPRGRQRRNRSVALCYVEFGRSSPAALARMALAHGGLLTNLHGPACIVAFSEGTDLLLGARAFAEDVASRVGLVAIHLVSVLVRERPGRGPQFYGAALARPKGWLPDQRWSGLLLTAEAAKAAPFATAPSPHLAGFYALPRPVE
jgi:hypothetical protein